MSVQQRARLRHQRDIPGRAFDAGVMQWLVDQQLGAEHVMAYRLTVNPDSTASHAHPGAEEVMYVLEGSGEIRVEAADHVVGPGQAVFVPGGAADSGRRWIEDEPVGELRPGSVVFFPIGVRHTLENTGQEDMKVLGAFSPAGSPEAKIATA